MVLSASAIFCQTQEAADSTKTSDPDVLPAADSLSAKADTAAVDTVAPPPPFDFREHPALVLRGLYRDSTMIIGSRYTSFGDVLDWLPGGYYANLGASGQLAYGSLFGAPAGEFVLDYDGLVLNNPINGAADLNLVPTQAFGNFGVVHSAFRPWGDLPLGASLYVRPQSIADNPIRSQVGYRTGYYGYDDIDVRVGIVTSKKQWIDCGGLIKNYVGLKPNQVYDGQKINLTVNRRLGADWLAKYMILFNLRKTDVPLAAPLPDWPGFDNSQQKDRRTDHAVQFLYKSRFKTILQFTKFEQDLHAQQRSVFDERHDAYVYRLASEANGPLGFAAWRAGLAGSATFLSSNNWGKKQEWQAKGFGDLHGKLSEKLNWLAGARLQSQHTFNPVILPEFNLFYAADTTTRFSLWANQVVKYPTLQQRFADGPFALGGDNLTAARYDQVGVAGEKQTNNLFLHGSLAWQRRSHQIAALVSDEVIRYVNLPKRSLLSLSAAADYQFCTKWRFVFKGDAFKALKNDAVFVNRPDFYVKTFLQYHLIKFKGDLNARLRLGAFVLGGRRGPLPYYAEASPQTVALKPSVYPYLHAVLLYRATEIFLSYENYIDADMQYVYGYSMPSLWFRYGFIWHFVD